MRCTALLWENLVTTCWKCFSTEKITSARTLCLPFFSIYKPPPGFDKTVAASASILISLAAAAIVYEPAATFAFFNLSSRFLRRLTAVTS